MCARTYLANFQRTKNMVLKQTAIKIYKPLKKGKAMNVNPYCTRKKQHQRENHEYQQPNKNKMIEVGANISVIAMSIKGIIFHTKHALYKRNPIKQKTQSRKYTSDKYK